MFHISFRQTVLKYTFNYKSQKQYYRFIYILTIGAPKNQGPGSLNPFNTLLLRHWSNRGNAKV